MNQRLQQFLELENITPAKLSDILGVQRSNISHILSGRNKPSYDFICRIISRFPSINSEWLLTGKGKPYKDFLSNNHPDIKDNGESNSLFSESNSNSSISESDKSSKIITQEPNNELIKHDINQSQLNENQINDTDLTSNTKKRAVKRIVIFYNDGSFEEFKQEF